MKRSLLRLALVATCAALAACASPHTATLTNGSITNGSITNITSAEATTLAKQSNRTKRANDVMENAPPIFQMKAQPGQKIEISGVESITVNVPIDQALMMSDQADVTSENVQMAREVVNGVRAATPIALGGMALSDRNSSRAAALEAARIESAERGAQNAAQAEFVKDALNRPQGFITLPEGGSAGYLTPN